MLVAWAAQMRLAQLAAALAPVARDEWWVECQMPALEAARAHARAVMTMALAEWVAAAPADLALVLHRCGAIFAIDSMLSVLALAADAGVVSGVEALLHQARGQLVADLADDGAVLVDGFGFPDFTIKSPLALASGDDAYGAYLRRIGKAAAVLPSRAEYWSRVMASKSKL